MKSSVLVVGEVNQQLFEFGADFTNKITSEQSVEYPVFVIPFENKERGLNDLRIIQKNNPTSQKIFLSKNFDLDCLRDIVYQSPSRNHFSDFNKTQIENSVKMALFHYQSQQQDSTFRDLKFQENENLKHLNSELNQLNEKRDKNLERSKKRYLTMSVQIEALHNALLGAHTSQSVAEMESLLFSALAESLNLNWVRVFLFSNDHLENQLSRIQGQKLFKSALQIDNRQLGKLVVARKDNKAFTKREEESLEQITESVALALDRLAKFEQAETLKLQWDSTFDAISEPLCLTDENFKVIKTNKAFNETTKKNQAKLIGLNCFSAFCGDDAPAKVEQAPASFLLQRTSEQNNEPQYFEISTQRIRLNPNQQSIVLVFFRNVTTQKKIEKQIFESAKMAELGTIGSSIAHDINNPLGGMINFIQLIKMGLKVESPIYEDITQMEAAGQRCKDIVENLLKFSRRHDLGDSTEEIDLGDIIEQNLKIMELQTRSLGIQTETKGLELQPNLKGHAGLFAQAFNFVLQNAFDAVTDRLSLSPGYKGFIKVDLSREENTLILQVTDNGVGISPENQNKILNPLFTTKNKKQGLGLTLAYQVFSDHGGQLEVFSQPNVGTTVKISFLNV